MLELYLEKYKDNLISNKQLCYYANIYANEVIELTPFLNEYNNVTINERLYYIINNLSSVVRCKYCNNKAIFSNRLTDGYKNICNSNNCKSKQLSESHIGKTKISNKRNEIFIKLQKEVKEVNDNVIINLIKYNKFIDLIDNKIILDYIDNRYNDSNSRLESIQRLKLNIEEKPKCPTCGHPVKWIGKPSKLYTTFCCDKCSANNKLTVNKRKQTLKEKWGTENCYDSSLYQKYLEETIGVKYHTQRKDIIEKRKETLIDHYGTTNLFSVPEIQNKILESNRKIFGCDHAFQNENVRNAMYESLLSNGHGTSKAEDMVYRFFIEIGWNVERWKKTEEFPFCVDFYYNPLNLYIEFHGSQYHHGRPFLGSEQDYKDLDILMKKDKDLCKKHNVEKSMYNSIINTWTIFDVKKRKFAKDHNINYIEIYKCKSKQELLQFLIDNKLIQKEESN